MSRRAWVIVVGVAAVACVVAAVVLVWRPYDSAPAVGTKALGVWQEQTAADPLRMTVSAAGDEDAASEYWVTMAGSTAAPFPARLEGEKIVVRGEDARSVLWDLTYDEGADVLLLAREDGAERRVLRRISR